MRRYLSTGFAEQVGKNLGESVSKCKKLFGWGAIGFFVLFFGWANLSRKNSSLVRRIVWGVSHRQFPVIGTSPGTCHGFPPHSHPEGAHVVRQRPRCGKTFHLISDLVPATARGGSAVYNAPRFTVPPRHCVPAQKDSTARLPASFTPPGHKPAGFDFVTENLV